MVSVNKEAYNNRKVAAVATGALFTTTTSSVTKNIPYAAPVVDPLETISNDSGDLFFTAPYSRYYSILVKIGYTPPAVSSPVGQGSSFDSSAPVVASYMNTTLTKNGSTFTTGVVSESGTAGVVVGSSFITSAFFAFIDTASTLYKNSELVTTTFLESGDTLKFRVAHVNKGINVITDITAGGTGTSITAGQLFVGAPVAGGISTSTPGIGIFTETVDALSLSGNVNVALSGAGLATSRVASVNIAANYYVEITELDRE